MRPRIRSLKPEFFQDEALFDAERESGLPLRLAYQGLWCMADREGRFEWRPRALKANILPFEDVDFSRVLDALGTRGWLVRYASPEGREYGWIRNFRRHQSVNNKEAQSELPGPTASDIEAYTSASRAPRVTDATPTRAGKDKAYPILSEPILSEPNTPPTPPSTGSALTSLEGKQNGNGHRPRLKSFDQIQSRLASVLAEVADGTRARLTADELRDTQADLIFAYWQAKLDHKDALLDAKRLGRLRSRLIENGGNVHELLYVIDGALKDRNLMGQNEFNRKYDGVETIFRDRGQVERLAKLGGFIPGKPHPMAEKYLGATT